jgi:membrane protease subunit HflK
MRRVVGDIMVTEVLTTGRVGIAGDAKQLMQQVLDKYDMGILIRSIKLQDVNPPKKVQASFNEVNAAKQEQEKMINQAEQAYNKVIPEARGKAKKLVSEAEGYAQAVVNRAEGDSERFSDIYKEYRKAPAITKKRLYLEAMEELFAKLEDIVIIDSRVKGLLPVFGKGITNEK